ncbi:SDR family NAD(P)-dependent oxidoreductase [Oceanibium sediminis]|uniref:SDR family NAD(P)-dependent oxidoreductase n=1 Tax=Oceanibium sediminis TaxID=2026339 RepID=UPI000DD44E30|nr:SDR family NAD(P)-dependent oxidoreductase [Oceanibium sediminis]
MNTPFDMTGQTAWITGSGSGIGTAIALLFASAGANVVLHGLNQRDVTEALKARIEAEGGRALALDGDLTDAACVSAMCAEIDTAFGGLSTLVNCAGGSPRKSSIADMDEDAWDQVIALNLKSVFLASRAAIPMLRKADNPSIVNVSSCVTRSGGVPGGAAYAAAKGGVDVLTRALAKELAPDGIRVNAVAPGLVDSPFHAVDAKEKYAHLISRIPLARIGEPDDLAGPALFLASQGASYITGEIIEVSGGTRLVS